MFCALSIVTLWHDLKIDELKSICKILLFLNGSLILHCDISIANLSSITFENIKPTILTNNLEVKHGRNSQVAETLDICSFDDPDQFHYYNLPDRCGKSSNILYPGNLSEPLTCQSAVTFISSDCHSSDVYYWENYKAERLLYPLLHVLMITVTVTGKPRVSEWNLHFKSSNRKE